LGEINALLGLVLKKHLKLPFSSIKHKEVFSTFTDENNESTDALHGFKNKAGVFFTCKKIMESYLIESIGERDN